MHSVTTMEHGVGGETREHIPFLIHDAMVMVLRDFSDSQPHIAHTPHIMRLVFLLCPVTCSHRSSQSVHSREMAKPDGTPCPDSMPRDARQPAFDHVVVPGRYAVAAIVWLHGFGDGPEGWADEFRGLHAQYSSARFVYLRAPRLPQTCYRGALVTSWGDYHDEECTRKGTLDYDNQNIVSEAVLAEAHAVMDEIVDSGLPASSIVVGGFSMGATAAAEVALRYSRGPIGGLVMLNGWLLPRARAALAAGPLPRRVLVSHGSADEQVGFDIGSEAADMLRRAGVNVSFKVQEGMAHVASAFGPGKGLAISFLSAAIEEAVAAAAVPPAPIPAR